MPTKSSVPQRHIPLDEEYNPSQPYKTKSPKKRKERPEEDGTNVVDPKASRKILKLGGELEEEDLEQLRARQHGDLKSAFELDPKWSLNVDEEKPEDEEDEEAWENEEDEEVEVEEIDPQDLATFNRFNPDNLELKSFMDRDIEENAPETGTRSLADIILAKIAEHEALNDGIMPDDDFPAPADEEEVAELPPKVEEVYTKIGHLLSRHKSGRLPKPFKIIPTLPLPMQHAVIPLTRPENWTPNAIKEATRLFVSSNAATAQSFLTHVLLTRVREDIHENKKLNVHLYDALKKSLYKPAAFFKGILFPLLTESCTLREAHIIASIMTRVSIPVLHSAAALARCCDIAAEQMSRDPDAASATNLCVKALLDKKYALPYQTIDALVFHFLRFRPAPQEADGSMEMDGNRGSGKLPVIWHQTLLVFAQRYRDEIAEEQREALLDLLLARGHKDISPEIRRELLAGRGRGTLAEPVNGVGDGGDDTLMAG